MEMNTTQLAKIIKRSSATVSYFMRDHGYCPIRIDRSENRPVHVYSEEACNALIDAYTKPSPKKDPEPQTNNATSSPDVLKVLKEIAKNTEDTECYTSYLKIIAQRQVFMEGLLLELVSKLTGKKRTELMQTDFTIDDEE